MKKRASLALMVLLGCAFTGLAAAAEESTDQAKLAKALTEAKVSLDGGLAAAAREGKPISAKFEIGDDGKLQLSIYTGKGDKYSEVIVDHRTGKIAKAEPITSGEDLAAAKSQNEAMAKAKLTLAKAVAKAAYANKGYRAVSAYPALKDGHPVADVTLHKGDEWKTVSEKLD